MAAMDCPGCGAAMSAQTFEAHLGRSVALDMCLDCQTIWFDHGESLQLSPASTLRLFRLIGDQGAKQRRSFPSAPTCPRCGVALRLAHDRQRNTPFQYWRCPSGHGRLTSFFDFLREKSFIRVLSPKQIEELRRNVQMVNCSNCGAPIDLARGSACTHCGSPLSMLDVGQTKRLIEELQAADKTGKPVDPALPLEMERARREVEQAFASFEHQPGWFADVSSGGLVGAGLAGLARWLGRSLR